MPICKFRFLLRNRVMLDLSSKFRCIMENDDNSFPWSDEELQQESIPEEKLGDDCENQKSRSVMNSDQTLSASCSASVRDSSDK